MQSLALAALLFGAGTFAQDTTAQVGGRVWRDWNADGIQNNGEPGIGGVPVGLWRDSALISTRTTNGNGLYQFTSVAAGTYVAKFNIFNMGQDYIRDPYNAAYYCPFSPANVGDNPQLNSKVTDCELGTTSWFNVTAGESITDINAGVLPLSDSGDGSSGLWYLFFLFFLIPCCFIPSCLLCLWHKKRNTPKGCKPNMCGQPQCCGYPQADPFMPSMAANPYQFAPTYAPTYAAASYPPAMPSFPAPAQFPSAYPYSCAPSPFTSSPYYY